MSSGSGQLVLVRHGATEWSTVHKHTGRTDLPLTDEGRAEAVDAGKRLDAEWRFANVFASPLQRARTTAELAGFNAPIIDNDLMEWDYGEHDGLTTLEIRAERPGYSKWVERPPGGESVAEVGERVDRFLAKFTGSDGDASVEGDTVIFAHGHLLAILIARWLGLDATDGRRFPLKTATLTVLGHRREEPVLHMFNA